MMEHFLLVLIFGNCAYRRHVPISTPFQLAKCLTSIPNFLKYPKCGALVSACILMCNEKMPFPVGERSANWLNTRASLPALHILSLASSSMSCNVALFTFDTLKIGSSLLIVAAYLFRPIIIRHFERLALQRHDKSINS